ncbi:MAG: N-acetylglucosamine-6-phosphate deacetylase [Oscillospiraceae bacterium]|nr:N-acetylglucosamine-6-phosphate deacetylase [Oscillospiraceae bacterium]
MVIKNGNLFTENAEFVKQDIAFSGEKIDAIGENLCGEEVFDATDCYVIPGFVDIHIHGAYGSDFCDNSENDINTIAKYLVSQGVTSFLGTTMAFDEPILSGIFATANPFFNKVIDGQATLRGVNMEGPFFNKAKKGAQAEKYIVDPDWEMFERLFELSGRNIRLLDIAPELPGAVEFIEKASKLCHVSVAHTSANYDQAIAGFEAGADHVTHLFNAMPPMGHRDPGVVGAAQDKASYVEIISDGIHIHPAIIRTAFRLFGDDRMCLISDAMRACGMPDGEYSLGGQKVFMNNGKATLEGGTIAGSATVLAECVRRAVSFGIRLESAIKAATINPAKSAGLYDVVGSLREGKQADVVVLDKDLQPKLIVLAGKVQKF